MGSAGHVHVTHSELETFWKTSEKKVLFELSPQGQIM